MVTLNSTAGGIPSRNIAARRIVAAYPLHQSTILDVRFRSRIYNDMLYTSFLILLNGLIFAYRILFISLWMTF